MTKPKPPLEKVVQLQIKRAAHALGFTVSDLSQPRATMQTPGLPDLFMTHSAKRFTCWVEVKRQGGKPTPTQTDWHEMARSAGNHVLVADSVDSFIAALEAVGFPVHA